MSIHPELNQLLDWTWTNRVPIMVAGLRTGKDKGSTHRALRNNGNGWRAANGGIGMIYDKYTELAANEQTGGALEAADIKRFLEQLSMAPMMLRPRPRVLRQDANGFETTDFATLSASKDPLRYKGNFIHFRHPQRGAACTHRVYINLREATRGTIFATVLGDIWDIHGVRSAKVAVPGVERADSALVYCTGREPQGRVVEALKDIHKLCKGNAFGRSLPKLVEHVPGMHGVGKATEPPHLHLMWEGEGEETMCVGVETGQSFGMYRAAIIFTALERTEFPEDRRGNMRHGVRESNDETKGAFKRLVKQYFEKAGLSVTNPAQQGPPGDYMDLSRIAPHLGPNGKNAGRA